MQVVIVCKFKLKANTFRNYHLDERNLQQQLETRRCTLHAACFNLTVKIPAYFHRADQKLNSLLQPSIIVIIADRQRPEILQKNSTRVCDMDGSRSHLVDVVVAYIWATLLAMRRV